MVTFEEVVDHALAMVQRRGRVTYRMLKQQFDLDDASLEDLLVITDSVDLARHRSSSQKPVNSPANYRRSACH